MTYRVADTWDNEGAFADLNPQPANKSGVQYPEVYYGGDQIAQPKGYRTLVLEWNSLSRANRASLMTQLGLSDTVLGNEVTMRLPDGNGSFGNWNCVVNYDQSSSDRGFVFPRLRVNVVIVAAT